MKRLAVFALAVLALGMAGALPFETVDCSGLVVVQVLAVGRGADGAVTVYAPDGLRGEGAAFDDALDDLAAHAPGTLFLGAAEHLILADAAAASSIARSGALRPAVRLYASRLAPETLMEDAQALGEFLAAHPGAVRLGDLRAALYEGAAVRLPALRREAGGYETV